MTRNLKWLVFAVVPLLMASNGGGCSGAPETGVADNPSALHQESTTKECKPVSYTHLTLPTIYSV